MKDQVVVAWKSLTIALIVCTVVSCKGQITGKVTEDGQPIPDTRVAILTLSRPTSTKTDEQGEYQFHSVNRGRHYLKVQLADSGDLTRTMANIFDLGFGETKIVDFEFEKGTGAVHGSVINKEKPNAEIPVTLVYHGFGPPFVDKYWKTKTNTEGDFMIDGLTEGDYRVYASFGRNFLKDTLISATREVTVTSDQTTSIDFRDFLGSSVVEGRVTRKGKPISYANVDLVSTSSDPRIRAGEVTDEKGEFRIPNLPEGSYVLSAESWGFWGNTYRSRDYEITIFQGETLRRDIELR